MIQLLIDDGVTSRGHRQNIFSSDYKLVGFGIQTHKKYKWMTCTNFATSFKTKKKEKQWVKCAGCPLPKTQTPVIRFPLLAIMKIPMTVQMTPIKWSRVGTVEMMTAGPPMEVAVQALGSKTRLGTNILGTFLFVCLCLGI
jgi:hypothetical protein